MYLWESNVANEMNVVYTMWFPFLPNSQDNVESQNRHCVPTL